MLLCSYIFCKNINIVNIVSHDISEISNTQFVLKKHLF